MCIDFVGEGSVEYFWCGLILLCCGVLYIGMKCNLVLVWNGVDSFNVVWSYLLVLFIALFGMVWFDFM